MKQRKESEITCLTNLEWSVLVKRRQFTREDTPYGVFYGLGSLGSLTGKGGTGTVVIGLSNCRSSSSHDLFTCRGGTDTSSSVLRFGGLLSVTYSENVTVTRDVSVGGNSYRTKFHLHTLLLYTFTLPSCDLRVASIYFEEGPTFVPTVERGVSRKGKTEGAEGNTVGFSSTPLQT